MTLRARVGDRVIRTGTCTLRDMDPTTLAWLGIWIGLLGTVIGAVIGAVWSNSAARKLALESGSLDKPELTLSLLGLPSGTHWTITLVLPEATTEPVTWELPGSVTNVGKRASQDIFIQVVVPQVALGERTIFDVNRGSAPAAEANTRHEVAGEFGFATLSLPNIAPAETVGVRQECRLQSTTVTLNLGHVETADGDTVQFTAQAEVSWTASLQVRSLDSGWMDASVSIRVAVGRSVEAVAEAKRQAISRSLLVRSGMESATGLRRLAAWQRHQRLARMEPASYFVVPKLKAIDGRLHADVFAGDWSALIWFDQHRQALVEVQKKAAKTPQRQ